jgi:hypothetical protein
MSIKPDIANWPIGTVIVFVLVGILIAMQISFFYEIEDIKNMPRSENKSALAITGTLSNSTIHIQVNLSDPNDTLSSIIIEGNYGHIENCIFGYTNTGEKKQ